MLAWRNPFDTFPFGNYTTGINHLKSVSISDVMEEIKNTLLMKSESNKRQKLGPLLLQLDDLQIQKGTKKVHLLDFVSRHRLWIKYQGDETFHYGTDLVDFFLNLLSSKSTESVSMVYSEIEWLNANVPKHPKTGVIGLLVETEMEKSKCVHFCLDLSGAYQTSVPETDIKP